MISYRLATKADCVNIAALHAKNWQETYRGAFDDYYLDHEINEERLEVWEKRFSTPNDKQHIYIACDGDTLVGFECTYSDYHPELGAYMDNLHVKSGYQGYGIGRRLMSESARFALSKDRETSLYLYVLNSNLAAIEVYTRWGGINIGSESVDHRGATEALTAYKFMWKTPEILVL
jgi:ribosomal protein S18 acetylase RimI-like enzyme